MSETLPHPPCAEIITLAEKVRQIEMDMQRHESEIQTSRDFRVRIETLVGLSIGGGALSLLNLIILLVNLVQQFVK